MKKIYIYILLIIIILFSSFILSGCSINGQDGIYDLNDKPTKLKYYTIGNPDKDLDIVTSKINKVLSKKLNIIIEYNKIAWGDYGTKLATIISSGGDFDIAFATNINQGDFVGNAKKGAWLDLSPYINSQGKEMFKAINPLYWEGIKIDGKIFGVPTNKEIAVPLHFIYSKSLVDKYDIHISQYKNIQSLEPILNLIHKNEPDYIGLKLDSYAHNYFAIDGYEYILNHELPLMIKSTDKDVKVTNIFETEYCKNTLISLRKYYKSGYINEDAPIKENGSFEAGKKIFLEISAGGPYADVLWSNDRQYQVVTQQISDLVVTTESTQGGIMVVNSMSKHPTESVSFLNCLNTDEEVRNLFNFGIKDKHYKLTDNGQVNKISNDYSGIQYTQGNWFILKTVVGEPLDKWKQFSIFNNSTFKSEALGFSVNTTLIKNKLTAIKNINDKYYSCLMTGSVDIETFLPRFNAELKVAGIDEVKAEIQKHDQ